MYTGKDLMVEQQRRLDEMAEARAYRLRKQVEGSAEGRRSNRLLVRLMARLKSQSRSDSGTSTQVGSAGASLA